MTCAKHYGVDNGKDVALIVRISIGEFKKNVVANEKKGYDPRNELMPDADGDNGGQSIANAQSRQHTKNTEVGEHIDKAVPVVRMHRSPNH